jgi:hypothetical protein
MGTKRYDRREIIGRHLDRKLSLRLRIFVLIFIIMLGIISYDIFQQTISFVLAGGGLLLGIIIGFVAGRTYVTKWHEQTNKVITQIDEIGVVVLILYIAFSVFRSRIFGHWLHGPTLTAFTFSITCGIMLGRLFTTVRGIKNVLSDRGIT